MLLNLFIYLQWFVTKLVLGHIAKRNDLKLTFPFTLIDKLSKYSEESEFRNSIPSTSHIYPDREINKDTHVQHTLNLHEMQTHQWKSEKCSSLRVYITSIVGKKRFVEKRRTKKNIIRRITWVRVFVFIVFLYKIWMLCVPKLRLIGKHSVEKLFTFGRNYVRIVMS